VLAIGGQTSRSGSAAGAPPPQSDLVGRLRLAVVLADEQATITRWSRGAVQLFGMRREDALGRSLDDLLTPPQLGPPLAGAGEMVGAPGAPGAWTGFAAGGTLGEAREFAWWSYPLTGPQEIRRLVIAAEGGPLRAGGLRLEAPEGSALEQAALFLADATPSFAKLERRRDRERVREQFTEILPKMNPEMAASIAEQVAVAGFPALESKVQAQVLVAPDWGVKRRAAADQSAGPLASVPSPTQEPAAGPTGWDEASFEENKTIRERLEFLADATKRIGTTLNLQQTVDEVTAVSVPRFCDFAGIHLRDNLLTEDGFPDTPPDENTVMRRASVVHTDEPGRWDDTVPIGERMTFPTGTPFLNCMRTGEPVLVPYVDEEMAERVASRFVTRDLRPLIARRSMLVVPLIARNTVLGFLVTLRRDDRPRFTDDDRMLIRDLAARFALVLDNARMFSVEQNNAEKLQKNMLPQEPRDLVGVEIAYRFQPGARLGRVGGDWFDAIRLSGGKVALVVGDVMGHGLDSAAMMGQFRTAVQTMARIELWPGLVLRNLDDLALSLGENYLATCLYAVYDPVDRTIQIANAGHIPPVLVHPDGRSELMRIPAGAPIGVGGVPFETIKRPIRDGSQLLLCTDGLVEMRGGDIADGLVELVRSAAAPAVSLEEACDTVINALHTEDRNDDVALLMARFHGIPSGNVAYCQLDRDPLEVRRARSLTRKTLEIWGLAEAADIAELMVSELVTNAIRHSHEKKIELRLLKAGAVLCEVTDDDHSMPVLTTSGADQESGRGLALVSLLAKRWGTRRTANGKTVWFEQAIG
jgi:anti-sigma regulatory factor (Ser/Thr protein kinase)